LPELLVASGLEPSDSAPSSSVRELQFEEEYEEGVGESEQGESQHAEHFAQYELAVGEEPRAVEQVCLEGDEEEALPLKETADVAARNTVSSGASAPTDEAESFAGEVQFEELEPLRDEQARDLESDAVEEFGDEESEAEDNDEINETYEHWSKTGTDSDEAEESFEADHVPAADREGAILPSPRWKRPGSVDEAIELFRKARAVANAEPPDEKRALEYVRWIEEFLGPLVQVDVLKQRYPVHGSFSGKLRDAVDRTAGWEQVAGALATLKNVRAKLEFGATVGGYWQATENVLGASRYFLEVLNGEGISSELRGVPPYRPSMRTPFDFGRTHAEVRLRSWLQQQIPVFRDAEKRWGINRCAIAGVIAWEALENLQFFLLSSVGPGKPHVRFLLKNLDNFAQQVERAGYLPKASEDERNASLATLAGAVRYIGAMMRAGAAVAWRELKVDLYDDPRMLAWIYNAQDLDTWKEHVAEKQAAGIRTFQPEAPIVDWIGARLFYLEQCVGKPHVQRPQPVGIEPIARATLDLAPGRERHRQETEAELIRQLELSIRASDVRAVAARKRRVIELFTQLTPWFSQQYRQRIEARRPDDKLVTLLFNRMGRGIRAEVLQILAGP
jgi:hypothetical protein